MENAFSLKNDYMYQGYQIGYFITSYYDLTEKLYYVFFDLIRC